MKTSQCENLDLTLNTKSSTSSDTNKHLVKHLGRTTPRFSWPSVLKSRAVRLLEQLQLLVIVASQSQLCN